MRKLLRVRFLLVLSITLTLVSAAITYLNVQEKKEATALIIHTYKVIQFSTRMLSSLKDMEIGHRSYLLTADTTFISPYHEALADITLDVDTLKDLVKENPRQADIIQQHIAPLIERKKNHLTESFHILKSFGRDSASHFAGMKIAKTQMDSIRYWIGDFIQHEQSLLKERSERLEQRYIINDVIRFSSFVLIGITSLAALVNINRKEEDNKRLLRELQNLNQQLEEKVRERTGELEQANADLVRLNEEKNHFLGMASHDLKAPLVGISGLLSLMRLDKDKLTPRHVEYISLMEETGENMQRLITDLLDLSRIETGTVRVNPQSISISKLLTQLHNRFRPLADKKKIELDFQQQLTNDVITTDPDLLARVLENLLSNAIKFSPSGKKVIMHVHEHANDLRFDVIDQGPGIRPEEREKLFKKFQKLSARPTDGESSTGLGLSIVKDLVELLRGTVQVESRTGQGTVFSVSLPRVK
ncbi:MAG: CHASE3 domain-containing protein [Cyclobacteriaceae bacterium]|nr:CHASE3 domain-containing protein [Cyclobacteriaceae bacterium]